METVALFEKIWDTDIIERTEPLYSISLVITEEWKNNGGSLEKKLLARLQKKWLEMFEHRISFEYAYTKHDIDRSYDDFL